MGTSITYDNLKHSFEAVNFNPDGSFDMFTYTSTDGISWSGPTQVYYNNNPVYTSGLPQTAGTIRFLQGKYFLVFGQTINILQSADGNTWTSKTTSSQTSYWAPTISYDVAEGNYHMVWAGTDSGKQINDATSSDGNSWSSPYSFQSTSENPALAYDSAASSLLMAWPGTCCSGANLNVIQYRNVATAGGSGGGGGGCTKTIGRCGT
jgi:hypothetical protein